MKCHYPAVFACALLNSQPMGFYAPAQIVRDAREHGVEVRPVSVNHSFWDNTLERRGDGALALRLGFRQVKGIGAEDGAWIAAARLPGQSFDNYGANFCKLDKIGIILAKTKGARCRHQWRPHFYSS